MIEPLFKEGQFSFQSDDVAVQQNYCTYALNNPQGIGGSFSNFSAIDRQTVLNDDDGSLTGLKQTISVNEDTFFNAPVETIECESDETAKTSPYDYVTTVVYPGCASNNSCGENWGSDCGSTFCYGVPLYRQFSVASEQGNAVGKNIRMMGMNFFQRSNLTANNGTYYIDTSVSQTAQQNGLQLAPGQVPSYNVFQAGQTYYVFLIYAKATTKQTYQLFIGKNLNYKEQNNVSLVRTNLVTTNLDFNVDNNWPTNWKRKYDPVTGLLTVSMDLSAYQQNFDDAVEDSCQPQSFCEWQPNTQTCGCSQQLQKDNPTLYNECIQQIGADQHTICSWSVRNIDCPDGGCFGFAVTFPPDFQTSDAPPPAPVCFPNNADWNVAWTPVPPDLSGSCFNPILPPTQFCSSQAPPKKETNIIIGTDANDNLKGTRGKDIILGHGGEDEIDGERGDDWISGGPGNDEIRGGKGSDVLMGDEDNDSLFGESGKDQLDGGADSDFGSGGSGADRCKNVEIAKSCKVENL